MKTLWFSHTILQAFLTFSLVRALLHSPEPTRLSLSVFCLNTCKCDMVYSEGSCTWLYYTLAMWTWKSLLLKGFLNTSTNHFGPQFPYLANGDNTLSLAHFICFVNSESSYPGKTDQQLDLGSWTWENFQVPNSPVCWAVALSRRGNSPLLEFLQLGY